MMGPKLNVSGQKMVLGLLKTASAGDLICRREPPPWIEGHLLHAKLHFGTSK